MPSRRVWVTVAVSAALTLPGSAAGQTICGRPVQPLCSTDILAIESESDRQRCLDDVARYQEGLDEYLACLNEAIASAERTKTAVEEFRTCVNDGRADCSFEGAM